MHRRLSAVALVVALVALGLAVAITPASADTTTTVNLNCVGHAPIIGDQFVTQTITVSTAGPAVVDNGDTFSVTTSFPVDQIATSQSGGTVSSVKNLSYKVPVPANATFVNASVSGGFNYGAPVTVTLQGTATTGSLLYSAPGPIPSGQNYQLPALTLTLRATAASSPPVVIQPKLGGTSYSDPGFTTTAVVTSPISADVSTECYPATPTPPFFTTTIRPQDVTGPAITISTPVNGGQYPLGQSINAAYSCDDGALGTGVATCTGDVPNGSPIDTSSLGARTFTVNSTDNEGNASAPVTYSYAVVASGNDTTPPQITLASPPNGAVYTQGASLTANYTCIDNGSGIASCVGDVASGAAVDTTTPGVKSFTVTAMDNEGNPHTVKASYRVMAAGVQQNWTTGDVSNRMPVACDTLFRAFHESIPVTSNVAPASAGAGSQFNWSMAIADDYVPSFNNGSNLIYRWKAPTAGHFVSAQFTGPGSNVNGTAIGINPDGTLQLTIASVTDQSILGVGDDHFNPPPFRAVIQVDGAAGAVVKNQFDYFQLTTSLGGTSHCPAGDPTFNGRVNPILTNTTAIDSAPPTITISSPSHGATYAPGSVVPFTYACTDNVGTPTCNGTLPSGSAIATSTSGVYQLSVTSTDAAGNTAQKWVTYSVARPELSVNDVTVTEGLGASLDFVVAMSNPSTKVVSVNFETSDGTASAPSDYESASGAVVFAPGGPLSHVVHVAVVNDSVFKATRSMTFSLSDPANGTLVDGDAVGTIVDDDPPAVSVGDVQVTEGPGATLDFAVSLAANPNFPVAVDYSTADGSATAPDRYGAVSGSLVFNPGESLTQHVAVSVVDDTIYNEGGSPNNTQTMTLTATTPGNGASATGTGTIVDNEIRPPVLNIGSSELREGDAYNRPVKLFVTLNQISNQIVTVNYVTHSGSASAGTDFVLKAGTLTFKPGVIMKSVPLVIKGDLVPEGPGEEFSVELSSPSNAVIGDGVGEVSIVDDDSPSAAGVEASISDAKVYEGGGLRKKVAVAFTVSLSKRPTGPVTIGYTTTSGVGPDRAVAGLDFVPKSGTLTFTTTQVTKVITISVFADSTVEPNEHFSVDLTLVSGPVTLTDASGTGTILNDD